MHRLLIASTGYAGRLGVACIAVAWSVFPVAHAEAALGPASAPVTLIEYGSLTCDHCVHFHRKIFPRIKSQYIDTGRVRFIYRDFPTSTAAARGAIAARCANDDYYRMLDTLYASVGEWSRQRDIDTALVQKAVALGLDRQSFRACLDAPRHEQAITQQQRHATTEYGVLGTPTFLINCEVVPGRQNFDEIKALLESALSNSQRVNKAAQHRC